MTSLYDKELQEATLFELFKSDTQSDLEKALKVAQTNIIDKILKVPDTSQWTKTHLNAVKKKIDEEINKAYNPVFDDLQKELPKIASVVGMNILGPDYLEIPTETLKDIVNPNRIVQGYGAKELFKVTNDNHARQLKVLTASGVAQGKNANTIAREVQNKHSKLTKGQLKTAMFTSISEARAIARHESFTELESLGVIIGYEYLATLDSHTSEYCRNHDGRKYYKEINQIQHNINVHFNCRSLFKPITKSSQASDTRAASGGPVEGSETYGSWFSKQPTDFQKVVLGSKKYKAYQEGSYVIGGLPDVVGKTLGLEAISAALSESEEVFDVEKLPVESVDALKAWTGEDYTKIRNHYLGSSELSAKQREIWNNIFDLKGNSKADTVYRGISIEDKTLMDKILKVKVGDDMTDLAPSSWSSDEEVAHSFMAELSGQRVSVMFKLKGSKDKLYDIASLSQYSDEMEHLMAPGVKLKVKDVIVTQKTYYNTATKKWTDFPGEYSKIVTITLGE